MNLKNFPTVTAIIFDLGNVIIDLDIEATTNAFRNLYGSDYKKVMEVLNSRNVFTDYEKGLISTEKFVAELGSFSGDVSGEDIIVAWNAMLLNIPEERFDILKAAMNNYNTYCLSNTNELHIDFIYKQLRKERGIENLDNYFHKVYLSHEMHMRKPDTEIFQKVIDNHELEPQTTVFIDDTQGHLEGAKRVGLQVFHMSQDKDLSMLFD